MKIRVLEVLASLRRAGAERVAVSLACGLDPSRFETGVVSLYDAFPGGFENVIDERGLPVWHLGKRPGCDLRMVTKLARVFREFAPDVIHSHSYVMRYVLPAHVLAGRGQLIHTVHNLAEREVDRLGRMINRVAFHAGARAVALSADMARSFRRVYGFEPAAVIPNGCDTRNGYRPGGRAAWRAAHGYHDDDVLIVSVARLEPQKNPLGLIAAFAGALRENPQANLVLVGEGSLALAAREAAVELEVDSCVHFPGVRQDVPEVLSACDLFALASDWEGAPVAVLEAMAAHLPVVATAVGGVPEMVEDGVSGLLVPAGDPGELGRALAALAVDHDRRIRMGQAAAERVKRFDASAMIESYAALFERLGRAVS